MKRLFVGVRVSTQTANALAAASEMLQRRARDAGLDLKFVAPTSYHVTVKFLGWTREEAIPALIDALDAAVTGVAPFRFRTARLGAFPSLDKASGKSPDRERGPRGPSSGSGFQRVAERLGFAREARAFHPHVTLARLAETRAVKDVVLPLSEQMFSESRVDGVILFESETKPSGSVYREISKIAFKQASLGDFGAPKRQTGALELGDETDDGWPRGHGQ